MRFVSRESNFKFNLDLASLKVVGQAARAQGDFPVQIFSLHLDNFFEYNPTEPGSKSKLFIYYKMVKFKSL